MGKLTADMASQFRLSEMESKYSVDHFPFLSLGFIAVRLCNADDSLSRQSHRIRFAAIKIYRNLFFSSTDRATTERLPRRRRSE